MRQARLPFDSGAMLTARVELPTSADARLFYDQLERNLSGVAGVQTVALYTGDPASGRGWSQFEVEARVYSGDGTLPSAATEVISACGRTFNPSTSHFCKGAISIRAIPPVRCPWRW